MLKEEDADPFVRDKASADLEYGWARSLWPEDGAWAICSIPRLAARLSSRANLQVGDRRQVVGRELGFFKAACGCGLGRFR